MDRRGAGGELGHSCPPDLPERWIEVEAVGWEGTSVWSLLTEEAKPLRSVQCPPFSDVSWAMMSTAMEKRGRNHSILLQM